MPRLPKTGKTRGRKRKFEFGDIAYNEKYGWVVVVDHIRFPGAKDYYYKVIRVFHRYNGKPYGRAIWVKNYKLRKPTEEEAQLNTRRRNVQYIYNANKRLDEVEGGRGCTCNCCVHTALRPSDVLANGTYKWEKEEEDESN